MTEGPFGEAKGIVAGYWILQVKSMDEAIEWAKRLPFEAGGEPEAEGEIEIRRVFEMEEFGRARRWNGGASSRGSCPRTRRDGLGPADRRLSGLECGTGRRRRPP